MSLLALLAVFSILCYDSTAAESSLYDEVKSLNASCYALDSCKVAFFPLFDHLWDQRICECGRHCNTFGTCCADSRFAGSKYRPNSKYESCQKMKNFHAPVMMVSKCSDDGSWSEDIKRKCESNDHSSGDSLLTSIPLTKAYQLITYKNYFCALCNNGGSNFLYWSVALYPKDVKEISNILNNFVYDGDKRSWVATGENKAEIHEADIQYVLPSYMKKKVKRCYTDLVRECNVRHRNSELEKKCESYYSPVKIESKESTTVYANVHCALCNNVETSLIRNSCDTKYSTQESMQKYGNPYPLLIDTNIGPENNFKLTAISPSE